MTNDETRTTLELSVAITFPKDGTKNHIKLLCFLPKRSRIGSNFIRSRRDHSKPMLRFLGFLATNADFESKFLLGTSVIRFTEILANTRSSSNKPRVQSQCHLRLCNSLRDCNH